MSDGDDPIAAIMQAHGCTRREALRILSTQDAPHESIVEDAPRAQGTLGSDRCNPGYEGMRSVGAADCDASRPIDAGCSLGDRQIDPSRTSEEGARAGADMARDDGARPWNLRDDGAQVLANLSEDSATSSIPATVCDSQINEAAMPALPARAVLRRGADTQGHRGVSPTLDSEAEVATRTGRPPEVILTDDESRRLLATYLKTNRTSERGSMTAAARLVASRPDCRPELREAILREQGPARASKHQLPVTVRRAMQASDALVTFARNPRQADVMFGHARGVLRRHWSEQRRLYAGERMSSDDGTINFVVCVPWPWGGCRCSEKFGVKVGRFQFLPVNDDASDFVPAWTFVVRPTGAYRAEDVCGLLGRTWRDTCRPDWALLERGTWESRRVQDLIAGAGVSRATSYAPRQKLIENVFNRLWTVLSVMPGQVGRYRGEMERENKLLAQAQAGSLDPRETFPSLEIALAALEEATRFHNRTPIESKQYGKWIPETRWREDLAAHPRPALDPSLSFLWAPEVRTWTVRRACVGGMVEQPLGVTLPAHWWAPALLDCEGRKVTAHFDPWEPQSPATLTLTEDWPQRGWKAGHILATGVACLEDLPSIARDASDALAVHMDSGANERAAQMRSALRAIVLREYRVLSADGTRARRETEVRAPSRQAAPTPTPTRTEPDRGVAPPLNRSQRELSDADELAELARIEAIERRHASPQYQPL